MWHGRPLLAAWTAALATLALAAPASAEPLLPDLVQEAPAQLGVVTASTGKGTRFRLGFRAAVNNQGAGPLVIDSRRATTAEPTMTSDQVVHHADGTTVVRPGVGVARYHVAPGHRHWHFQRFEVYELRSADGRLVRPSQKTGFCLGDRYLAVRPGPFHHYRAAYNGYCGLSLPELLTIRMGISPGFGDDYDPQLEGQFVDVTGLSAGRYDLVPASTPRARCSRATTATTPRASGCA